MPEAIDLTAADLADFNRDELVYLVEHLQLQLVLRAAEVNALRRLLAEPLRLSPHPSRN
jgi:hypothetical protein